ncbi:MAG: alpha/beta fold hydrolase, partial [Alphaproteobacteria bacterium]
MFVHSYLQNGAEYEGLACALAGEGWRIYCPDLAGHGRSGWREDAADYRFELYAADVVTMIAMSGADKVHLLGSSMGGIIGMRLAGIPDAPIRSLVLNDVGAIAHREALQRVLQRVPERTMFATLAEAEAVARRFYGGRGPLPAAQWEMLLRAMLARYDDKIGFRYDPRLVSAMQAMAERRFDRWERWTKLDVPTLVIRGEHSEMLTAEIGQQMIEARRGADLLTMPDAGHPPWLRAPDQMDPVLQWLKRAEALAAP